jgi:hypothetical protein
MAGVSTSTQSQAPQQPKAPAGKKSVARGVSPITARRGSGPSLATLSAPASAAHDSGSGGNNSKETLESETQSTEAAAAVAVAVPVVSQAVPALRLLHGVFPPVLDMFGRTRSSPILFSGDKVRNVPTC